MEKRETQMENQKCPEKSIVPEIDVEKETEESAGEIETKNSVYGKGRETEMTENEAVGCESNGKALVVMGVYNNRERPPLDDCCPICFDAFSFPCRTSCGHWFCSCCILLYWRHTANLKKCKCPICCSLISRLIPESSGQIQPGEEVGKILKDIQLFNRLNVGGWLGLFLKALALPLLIRTRFREHMDPITLRQVDNIMRLIGLLLCILYDCYDFHFIPNGRLGILLLFDFLSLALVMFLVLDGTWYEWTLRRRARDLDPLAASQQRA